jgi:hypothetical protein
MREISKIPKKEKGGGKMARAIKARTFEKN